MNIGVAPVPQALPDDPASWASFWVDVVPQSSKNPLAAWSYVSFLAQEDQQMLTFSEASNYRVFGPPYSLMSLRGELAENPYLAPALESAGFANTNELAGRAGNSRQVGAMKEAVNSVLGGRITPQQALTTAKESL
jgi:ABC-type glycerol-3-phosphate transport system substrate-binding protein